MDSYQDKIHRLEQDVLLRANGMSTVRSREHPANACRTGPGADTRSVHILSGDLAMHKRTLEPIKNLIYGLRRYDLERCLAIANIKTVLIASRSVIVSSRPPYHHVCN